MKREYTHVDRDGIKWRFEGMRPISEIADQVMDTIPPKLTPNKPCRLRLVGTAKWHRGTITIMSENKKSIAVELDELMPELKHAFALDRRNGKQVILLMLNAEMWYEDVADPTKQFEVEVPGE